MDKSRFNSGDLIFVSGKGPVSWTIETGCLSLPNIGPLGRWNWAGMSHVMIVCKVFGHPLAYESTSFSRPPCVRTGRENPKGVQAHRLEDVINGGDVWHYPLRAPLYAHEEDRLLNVLEKYLGTPYDYLGAFRSGGHLLRLAQAFIRPENVDLIFCSELVVKALVETGRMRTNHAGAWSPQRLVRHVRREGVCERGELISY